MRHRRPSQNFSRRIAMPWLLVAVAVGFSAPRLAADEPTIDYLKDVKPLLQRRCVACHGALRQEGGLRLDAVQFLRKGGDTGPGVNPGMVDGSLLIAAVLGLGDVSRMPAEAEPLPTEEIEILKRWVAAGAVAADEEAPPDPRQHWSFQPPRPQTPPASRDGNSIDAYLGAKLAEHGLQPVGPAPKAVLLRRVHLDLVGLPPSPDDVAAFLSDESPDALERVVDRLLDSPEYGERWGRHWMDVWRYSDWYGYQAELRNSARHIWRWRDWIVESLNDDKPYDRMIQEMLAADELDPLNEDSLRATGFLARNYYVFNRDVWLDSAVEHTGKAFLGLTLNCAKCHFHMYDPIPQQAYYEFRAIFEPYKVRTDRLPGQPNVTLGGLTRVYDADLTTPTYLYVRGNDKYPVKEKPLSPAVPEFLLGRPLAVEPVTLPNEAWFPGLKDFIQREAQTSAETALAQARQQIAPAEQQLQSATAAALPFVNLPADASAPGGSAPAGRAAVEAWETAKLQQAAAAKAVTAAEAQLAALATRRDADLARFAPAPAKPLEELATAAATAERQAGLRQAEADVAKSEQAALIQELAWRNAREKQAEKEKAYKQAVAALDAARKKLGEAQQAALKADDKYTPLAESYPPTSSGRRLALARWITDPANPLTARVAVNHIWLRHFGEPLVGSVFDFGHNGQKPTHPELLDWLAVEFQRHGWSMKWLHRQLVTSDAYQRHSSLAGAPAANLERDPDNRWYWRMTPQRLEAEVIRDNVLATAGQLDRRMGGEELAADKGLTTNRRSLYYRHAPEKSMEFLSIFDSASPGECYRRNKSIVPQQALALVNSELSLTQAKTLAADIASRTGEDPTEFVRHAFVSVLGREPTSEELATSREFLQSAADPSKLERLRGQLVHVLMNHNDFVTSR